MIDARYLTQVLDLLNDVAQASTPSSRQERPVKVHADDSTSGGNRAQLSVAEVTRVVSQRASVGVRSDYDAVGIARQR